MGATDQKDRLKQFKDSDFVPVLTLSFKDRVQAEAVAATFNAACKSGKLGARARVTEVLPTAKTTVPPMPL